MNSDFILLLPDEVFYEMLISLPLEFVIQLEETYYEERKEVFEAAKGIITKDLDVPTDLSFVQMKEYEEKEDDDKALFLINIGDYPVYVDKLADQLDDVSYLVAKAIRKRRDYTTLALLSRKEVKKEGYFAPVVSEKLYESTSYLVKEIDVEDTLSYYLFEEGGYLSQDSFEWLLDTFDFPLDADFIDVYLYYLYRSNKQLGSLLQHLTKEDMHKAYKQHLESLQTGISYSGSNYLTDRSQAEKDDIQRTFLECIEYL